MFALIAGVVVGLGSVLVIALLKRINLQVMYGLILTGIAFLYVGYTWSDTRQFIINCIQAVVFLFIAYIGATRSVYVLAAGYILHGLWDLAYSYFNQTDLIPPHYDVFCLTVDIIMGGYIFIFRNRFFHRVT